MTAASSENGNQWTREIKSASYMSAMDDSHDVGVQQ